MKFVSLLFLMVTSILSLIAAPKQQTEIKAETEPPVIFEKRTLLLGLISEVDYRARTAQLAKSNYFPSIKRKPVGLSANAGFGSNLTFGGLNRSWIVDGDAASGYFLYADLNGNGDLADDTPLKFQNMGGRYSLIYQTIAQDGEATYPYLVKMEITTDTEREQSSAKLSLAFYNSTMRRGKIRLGGRDVVFGLVGTGGFYNSKSHLIFFDMNGDGHLDTESENSAERYTVAEKYVNFSGVSYEYEVERFGRNLTLKPIAERLPDRETLLAGNPAPDFSFTDVNGQRHRLSDYRGKLVLLDFWGTWCPPCRAEAPKLSAAYQRLREKGFEIIGINSNDTEANFNNFISRYGMSWTHIRENSAGELQKLYRADTFPAYYLIDKNGVIVANLIKPQELIGEIEKQLSRQ